MDIVFFGNVIFRKIEIILLNLVITGLSVILLIPKKLPDFSQISFLGSFWGIFGKTSIFKMIKVYRIHIFERRYIYEKKQF